MSDEVARLREALEYVEDMIQQLPGGCDGEAEDGDDSPDDAMAHIGGLILQCVRKALEDDK